MASDFIDECSGYLRLTLPEKQESAKLSQLPGLSASARVLFKFDAQGDNTAWNNEHFISQVNAVIKIAEFKYPVTNNTIIFLFDHVEFWSLCLCK